MTIDQITLGKTYVGKRAEGHAPFAGEAIEIDYVVNMVLLSKDGQTGWFKAGSVVPTAEGEA